ncbi:MAG: hypothetical protein M3R02_22685 [Chloroflexota bacterium]|nr:hypothetical protein [Chloroflexota bacterium]
MQRLILAPVSVLALTFGFAMTASASGHNCGDYVSQAAAQSVYNADPSDPEGLDGPPGPTSAGEPGVACEDYDYANNPGTNPGLLGGGDTDNTDDTEDTSGTTGGTSGGGTTGGTSGGGTTGSTLPSTGAGVTVGQGSSSLVLALLVASSVFGLAGLRARRA